MLYLYPPGTRDLSQGGMPLYEAKNDKLIEVLNGRYDLEFEYPDDSRGGLHETLEEFSIIGADTPKHGVQPFFVSNTTKIEGGIRVEAKHVFFLLEIFNTRATEIIAPLATILEDFRESSDNPDLFTFGTNVTDRLHIQHDGACSMDILARGEDSILAKSRTELVRDGYHIELVDRVGRDTDHLLAVRKNINDFEHEIDYTKLTTRLEVIKKIDKVKFIPQPNGKGKLTEPYPKTGKASDLRVRYWNGVTGQLIDDGEGSFQVFDANGYSIIGGMQTGSVAAIGRWKKKEEQIKDAIKRQDERIKSFDERQAKNRERLKEQQERHRKMLADYNKKPNAKARERYNKYKETINNTANSIKKTDEQKAKTLEEKAEKEKELAAIPGVILGERKLEKVLAPGEYFIIMTRPADGYLKDSSVKRFESDGASEIVIDFHSNPEEYPEDDTFVISTTVDSPVINEYPYVFSKTVEVSDESFEVWDKDQPWLLSERDTQQNLYNWATEEMFYSRCDLPTETVSFSAGSEVLSSGLGLGDTGVILYEDYGIFKDLPMVEMEYSPMSQTYTRMVFGDKVSGETGGWRSNFNSLRGDLSRGLSDTTKGYRGLVDDRYNETMGYVDDSMVYWEGRYNEDIMATLAYGDWLDSLFGDHETRIANAEAEADEMVAEIEEDRRKVEALGQEVKQTAEEISQQAAEASAEAIRRGQEAKAFTEKAVSDLRLTIENYDLTGDGRNYFSIAALTDSAQDVTINGIPSRMWDLGPYLDENYTGPYTIHFGSHPKQRLPIPPPGPLTPVVVPSRYGIGAREIPGSLVEGKEPLNNQPITVTVPQGETLLLITQKRHQDYWEVGIIVADMCIMVNKGDKPLPWQPHYLDVYEGMFDMETSISQSLTEINSRVTSLDGRVSSLSQTVDGFNLLVSNLEGKFSQLELTVDGITGTVADMDEQTTGKLSTLAQMVDGVRSSVATLENGMATKFTKIDQTVDRISSTVASLDEGTTKKFTQINQTVSNISSTVSELNGNFTKLNQTVDSLSSTVSNNQTGNVDRFSKIEQNINSIRSTVRGLNGLSTSIKQTDDRITALVKGTSEEFRAFVSLVKGNITIKAPTIDLSGYVTFSDLSVKKTEYNYRTRRYEPTTVIHGGNIVTGTIGSKGGESWIDLDDGTFSFMKGALTHRKGRNRDDRGQVWVTSSLAITRPDNQNRRMIEFNAGGMNFYADNYSGTLMATIANPGDRLTFTAHDSWGGFGFRVGNRSKVLIANNVRNTFTGTGVTRNYAMVVYGNLGVMGDILSLNGQHANVDVM